MNYRVEIVVGITILFFSISPAWVYGQLSANFDFVFDSGQSAACAPVTVSFTDQSTGNITAHSWSIDGVTFSNQENPLKIFVAGGNYEVCLTVSDNTGATDQICKTIVVFDPPELDIALASSPNCNPNEVILIASIDSKMDSIFWDFGDGNTTRKTTSAVQDTQIHIFPAVGQYSITIVARDTNGCQASLNKPNLVNIEPEYQADFSASPQTGCRAPLTVDFNNESPNDPNVNYFWDFGDGNTSTQLNPTHIYLVAGTYTVSLTATNDSTNCIYQEEKTDFIAIGQDLAQFTSTIIDNGDCSNTEVSFMLNTANITSALWNFGDGNSSTEINPTHVYTTSGCFTPSVSITTSDGCADSSTASECIPSNGPVDLQYSTTGELKSCDFSGGHTLSFQGQSGNTIIGWFWDFGGAGTAEGQNVSFTFTEGGVYPITMTVLLPDSCQQSITQDTLILNDISPDFVSNYRDGCAPLPVSFISSVSNTGDSITGYEWNFGFSTSTDQNPTITFPSPGAYDIELTVTTASGCSGTTLKEGYIHLGEQPVLDFSAEPSPTCVETTVEFINNSSPNVEIWEWDFGDGGQSSQRAPEHEYQDTGSFDIQLVAYDHGCIDTLLIEGLINILPPIANFNFEQECGGTHTIAFRDTSIGADSWFWDFGDGTSSTEQHPTHFYINNGSYTVKLRVVNDETGCEHTTTRTLNISNEAIPVFNIPKNKVCLGDTIQIQNSSSNAATYEWIWPAAQVALITRKVNDPEPLLFFPRSGAFTGFGLNVTDANGCKTSYMLDDTIRVSETEADFDAGLPSGCSIFEVEFTSTSTSSFSGGITDYFWKFGDGESSNEQNPTHLYSEEGRYTVSLTVTNDAGCSDTKSINDAVIVDVPVTGYDFVYNNCQGTEVNFTNTTTSENAVSYFWDFGDGQTSTATNPNHIFPGQNNYTVCLTSTNSFGCSTTFCDTLGLSPPIPDFSGDVLYKSCPDPPLVTNFTDNSTGAVRWEWNFGDGSGISTLQHPSHAYTEAGYYTVCLTVYNEFGCQETKCLVDYIQIDGPKGSFDFTPEAGCAPYEVNFAASGINIVEYQWDFGDGNGEINLNPTGTENTVHTYDAMGRYYPVLIIKDGSGCKVPVSINKSVLVQELNADFTVTDSVFCEEGISPVSFTPTFSDLGIVSSVEWSFPGANPASSTALNPSGITYQNAGRYPVTLIASSAHCQDTVIKEEYITINPTPAAAFGITGEDGCVPESVQLTDASTVTEGTIVGWNWNSGNGQIDTLASTEFDYPDAGTYTVQLQVTTDQGCTDTQAESLNIIPGITVDAGVGAYLCIGESVELIPGVQGTNAPTYNWSPASGLSCTNCPRPLATPTQTTYYVLTVSSPEGCTAVDSVLVELSPYSLPNVQLPRDTFICRGDSIQIIAGGASDPAAFNWDPSRPGLSCYTGCADPFASPLLSTTYVVTVTGEGGCTATDSVRITVIGEGIDVLGEDRTICLGNSVSLEVLNGSDPVWTPAEGLSCSGCMEPVASPANNTVYTVEVSYNNCRITEEIAVNVLSLDDIDAGRDTSICPGTSTILKGRFAGESYWSANGLIIATNEANPTVSPDETTTYLLTVTNDLCTLTDSVTIEILSEVEIIGGTYDICEGESVQVEVTGNANTFQWSPASGLSATNVADPVASPEKTTVYTVEGSAGNCQGGLTQVVVNVHKITTPDLPDLIKFGLNEEITLNATVPAGNNYDYLWSPAAGLSCPTCPVTTVTPDSNAIYAVEITDLDYGCLSTVTTKLQLIMTCDDESVVIPTAFTPNNDGQNDVFYIRGSAKISLLRIFNRWGELIFETSNPDEGWDGRYQGSLVNRGVFVYYLEGICRVDGSTFTRSGDITVLR